MAANFVLTVEGQDDLAEAHDWYERDRPGRGAKFLTKAHDCIQAVCRTPRGFTPFHGAYRKAVVRPFPYVVVYRYDAPTDTVFVQAVFHTARDPDDLIRRLP